MSELEEITQKIQANLPRLKSHYQIKYLGLFGSYLSGRINRQSDLDLLVDFDSSITLFQFVALKRELSRLTGKKVDLVMKTALKPGIGKYILKEVRYL